MANVKSCVVLAYLLQRLHAYRELLETGLWVRKNIRWTDRIRPIEEGAERRRRDADIRRRDKPPEAWIACPGC